LSTKKVYDLAVVVGSYEKNGETKHRYQNVGVVLQKDDGGKFILMERSFNPSGVPYDPSKGNTILLSMFDPKPEGASSQSGSQSAAAPASKPAGADSGLFKAPPAEDFTDDIPF
jgi:hypothetical protein